MIMEAKMKTAKVLDAYRILSTAKYAKLDNEDKIKVWKIARALKPIATQFEEDSKDAAEKLKPTDDFSDRLQNAQEFEMAQKNPDFDASKLKMGAAEYHEFIKEFKEYDKTVAQAVKEFADKEVDLKFDGISEDVFGKLMASNDWTVEQAIMISDVIIG